MKTYKIILNNIKAKPIIFLLIIIAGLLEFFGLSLLYPLISLIFELPMPEIRLLNILEKSLASFNLDNKFTLLLIICLLIILKAVFLLIYRYACTINVINFQIYLQKKIFNTFFFTKYSFSASKKSPLINAISEQATLAQSAMQIQFNILENIIILFFLVTLSYFVSIKVLLVTFILSLIIIFLFKFTISLSRKFSLNLIKANELFYKLINKSLSNFKYIKVTNTNKKFFNEYKPIINDIKINTLKFTLLNRGSKIMIEPIVLILVSLIFFISLKFLSIPITTILVMYIIIARIFQKLLAIITLFQQYAKDSASVKYCYQLLDEIKFNVEQSGNSEFKIFNSLVLKNISFAYNNNKIIHNLSLSLPKNKITTIYGKSGIGKTTLSNLILGLLKPDSGEILLNNENIFNYKLDKYRNKVGYVSQDSSIFNSSLKDNLTLRNIKIKEHEIINYLKKFDLSDFITSKNKIKDIMIDQNTSNLSNGQKQRISIIRELISKPEILILDEITSSVDKDNLNKILKILKSFKKQTTIFIITHQSEYKKISDFNFTLINKKLKRI